MFHKMLLFTKDQAKQHKIHFNLLNGAWGTRVVIRLSHTAVVVSVQAEKQSYVQLYPAKSLFRIFQQQRIKLSGKQAVLW